MEFIAPMFTSICKTIRDTFHHTQSHTFISGFATYLAMDHDVHFPPGPYWYCALTNGILFSAFLCSTLLILSMTFDRFFSIIRPHKAATFNTVKRAKITIFAVVVFSILYNIPHSFISTHDHWQCLPYGKAMGKPYGQVYYWMSFVINYALPFVLLLAMNSVIIHKIRNRSCLVKDVRGSKANVSESQSFNTRIKSSESQMFAILLLVTFGFLILTTPGYLMFLFIMLVDFVKTPQLFAGYYLFYNIAHKLHTTYHSINFFLYVISGKKFRTDLSSLFVKRQHSGESGSGTFIESTNISSS